MQPRILVYDDEADMLEICAFVLGNKGYEVITRQSCTNVIKEVLEFQPDLVLMDNWIPDIGGIEATKAIKNHPDLQHIPVVFFTANNDIQKLAQEAGADAFMGKPFDLKEMEDTVAKTLEAHSGKK